MLIRLLQGVMLLGLTVAIHAAPEPWRLHAAMEGLTGILMCGWSGAFFFAAVNRLYLARMTNPVNE
jgi:hypothetical protein